MVCRKSLLRCNCHARPTTAEKAKTQVKGRDGRTRTVTRNTGNRVDGNGRAWCKCGCLVRGGQCSNITCSTRK